MSKYRTLEYLYKQDDVILDMILSNAISQLAAFPDKTQKEKYALDVALKAETILSYKEV